MRNKKSKRILYIEDYPIIQKVYSETLQNHGFKVDIADDGEKALELVTKNEYDIILLDLLLPQKSGVEFLKKYRDLDKAAKVIVLTDFDDHKTVATVNKYGVDHYWMKVDNTPHVLAEKLDDLAK